MPCTCLATPPPHVSDPSPLWSHLASAVAGISLGLSCQNLVQTLRVCPAKFGLSVAEGRQKQCVLGRAPSQAVPHCLWQARLLLAHGRERRLRPPSRAWGKGRGGLRWGRHPPIAIARFGGRSLRGQQFNVLLRMRAALMGPTRCADVPLPRRQESPRARRPRAARPGLGG